MANVDPLSILIVDDNKNNLLSLHSIIDEYIKDIQIIEANSGMEALNIIMKHDISLIILDVQMPDMDGFETAKAIRTWKKMEYTPIVFLTAAYKSEQFRQQGFAIGAADYLTKPINPEQLINRIQTYLRFIEQKRQYNNELEIKVKERTAELLKTQQKLELQTVELLKTSHELENRVEQRTAELLLAKNRAEEAQCIAESANLAKSQFLANMSHELRTPLNAIIGYGEILQEDVKDVGQDDFIPDLQKICNSGKHLLTLINDVLDISKIEAGKMTLYCETFEIKKLIDEIEDIAQPLVAKNANTLEIEAPSELGEIHTDMIKLRQMLLNLLSNAAKFTKNGIIKLTIACQDSWINFWVIDDGVGMTSKQQQKLFHAFSQLDASTTRRYGGTGLGLAITKEFAEMLGGSIRVESKFGHGSTFKLLLPLHTQPDNKLITKNTKLPEKEKVAVVIDDDVNIQNILEYELKQFGYTIACASNGKDGLKLISKVQPEIIFLDIMMPEMDGWQVLAVLKNDSTLVSIPVIITSNIDQKNKGYAMGAVEYLVKPIKREQLIVTLEKYRVEDRNKGLILLVEDDDVISIAVTSILEAEEWQVIAATNGKVALEYLQDKKPSLILLDLFMPVMDGFEFIENIKKNPELNSIPVIILTAKDLSPEEHARLNKYSELIFSKQRFNQDELISYLRNFASLLS